MRHCLFELTRHCCCSIILALAFAVVLPLIDQEKVVQLIFYKGLAKTLASDPISKLDLWRIWFPRWLLIQTRRRTRQNITRVTNIGEWPEGPGTDTDFFTCHGNLGSWGIASKVARYELTVLLRSICRTNHSHVAEIGLVARVGCLMYTQSSKSFWNVMCVITNIVSCLNVFNELIQLPQFLAYSRKDPIVVQQARFLLNPYPGW